VSCLEEETKNSPKFERRIRTEESISDCLDRQVSLVSQGFLCSSAEETKVFINDLIEQSPLHPGLEFQIQLGTGDVLVAGPEARGSHESGNDCLNGLFDRVKG